MTRTLLRRAVTQSALLAAVLAVVVAGCVLLGTCALLLTIGQEQALEVALARTDPRDVAVEVTLRTNGAPPRDVVDDATRVVAEALAPARPTVSSWSTSPVRPLTAGTTTGAYGYVVSADDVAAHAELAAGRWPDPPAGGPLEVAVPVEVARRLALAPGDEIGLAERRDGRTREAVPGSQALTLVVVGTFAPAPDARGTWDRDLLRGAGHDPTWRLPTAVEQPPVTAYGPFVAHPAALSASAVEVELVSLVARPDLAGIGPAARAAVARAVGSLAADVRDTADEGVSQVRARTQLDRTLLAAEVQGRVTRSTVLVVALVGTALAAVALALAGHLVTARREPETRLLVARGASRSRLVGRAAAESLVLAAVAAALAVPLASLLFRTLTPAPASGDAGPTGDVGVTPVLVGTVLLGALVLAGVLVAPSVRAVEPGAHAPRSLRGRVGRAALDVLLVALAVVGYLQLRGRPFAAGGAADPVLVAAPLLCLVAGSAVVLRVVPWVARRAELRAQRSRGLVLPLAAWEVARGGRSTGAALLVVLAAAGATFATSLGATWSASARDQAEAQVGTDVAVGRTAAAPVAQAASLTALTGATVVPVTDREVALGTLASSVASTGDAAPATHLVAVDTAPAAHALRGRLPAGTTWADLTAGLGPTAAVRAIALADDAGSVDLTVTGVVPDGRGRPTPDLTVLPSLVVETAGGARQTLAAQAVPLDGNPHPVTVPLPVVTDAATTGPLTLVAVDLRVALRQGSDLLVLATESRRLRVAVTVAATGTGTGGTAPVDGWSAAVAADSGDRLRGPGDVTVERTAAGTTISGDAGLLVGALVTGEAGLVLAGFPAPADVPVVLGRDLASAVAAAPGDTMRLQVGTATVVARVTAIAPAQASIPRGGSILADHDALTRALVTSGVVPDVVDVWWLTDVADPPAAAARVAAAGLGDPVTQVGLAERLRDDPLRVGVQRALWLLVAAAVALAAAGTALQTTAALDARAVDVARLQGMGVPRRSVVAALLVEHAAVSVLVVVAGAGVGAVTAVGVGPLLVVSPSGRTPVPAPVAVWSWPAQTLPLAALVVVCAAVVVPVASRLVRRATVAHLRMEGG